MLPVELLHGIVQLLSPTDIRSFSLVSRFARALTLPFIYGDLRYSGEVIYKVGRINQAGRDIKTAIKQLSLNELGEITDKESVIFDFLESLPNLKTLHYVRWKWSRVDRPSFHRLIASLRHCPLRKFDFWCSARDQYQPTPGPSGLQALNLYSYAAETKTGATGDQYLYLFKLVQPSFTTLVELTIYLSPHGKDVGSVPFDLRQLTPVGATLRSFTYYPAVLDLSILDIIPEIFPLLSKLDLTLLMSLSGIEAGGSGLYWKNTYDLSLAKNIDLQYLKIFTDLRDTDCGFNQGGRCSGCAEHRLRATQTLALACKKLERCWWNTFLEPYLFEVKHDLESNERVVVRYNKR